MKLGLAWRIAMAATLVALLIGVAFALLILAVTRERTTQHVANRSFAELAAANKLEQTVLDLETGARGYIITKDPSLLEPWDAATASYGERAQEWLALVDDPIQRARAVAVTNNVYSYVNQFSVPLVDRAEKGDPTASSVAETNLGKARVDEIRRQFDAYETTESVILANDVSNSNAASKRAVIAGLVGIIGSVALLAAFGVYLGLSIVRPVRRAAVLAGRVAAGDLSARISESGAAEIGQLEHSLNTMTASLERSNTALRHLADEQAALRRVATLVAEDEPPERVFQAVAEEIGHLLETDVAVLVRYERDGQVTMVAAVSSLDVGMQLGATRPLRHDDFATMVRDSGRVVTVDADGTTDGLAAKLADFGLHCMTAVPVIVENRVWGAVVVAWRERQSETSEVETHVAGFTELVATALANAQSRADLEASRARIVAAADETRRRIERDLHDGTQQRLVALGLESRTLREMLPPGSPELEARLERMADGLTATVEELQEVSRGLHPAILSRGGVSPALRSLARRSVVPVELDLHIERELPEPVAVAVYYVVSEALTNAAKHARAAFMEVRVVGSDGFVDVSIRDDGVGGADIQRGSGLVGLQDRVEALGGHVDVTSPPGEGTTVQVTIPIPRAGSG